MDPNGTNQQQVPQQTPPATSPEQVTQTPPPPEPAYMPPFWKSKKFLFVFVILLLLGLGSFGGYYLTRTKGLSATKVPATPSPIVTAQPSPTAAQEAWETYTSKDGFSIGYPASYTPYDDAVTHDVNFTSDNTKPNTTSSNVAVILSVRDIPFSESPTGNKSEDGTDFITGWKEVTLAGVKAHEFVTHQCAPRCPDLTVEIPTSSGNKTITLQFMTKDTTLTEKMLSTFTFTSDTVLWKTFSHIDPSFSISYPSTYFVSNTKWGADFTPEKFDPDIPGIEDGFRTSYQDSAVAGAFNDLIDAKIGDDVKSAQQGVDVKVTKLKNLTLNGFAAVEYIHDGTIPPTSGLGRGPIPYSHIFLVKISDTSYLSITNSSMQSADVKARDAVFFQMVSSLKIAK